MISPFCRPARTSCRICCPGASTSPPAAGPDFWQALADGHEIRLIAPLHAERPPATTPLLVRADLFDAGEIASIEDLRGRPVSSPSPGTPLFWLHSALKRGGLSLDDVDLSFVQYEDVGGAFEREEVDAALLGERSSPT
ncbi:MAG: hypothetical protein R2849_10910 [Thermomicrobiales bacterium]